MAESPNKRIFLWALPRSLSTVFLKCVAHMDGAVVWHEPYGSVQDNELLKKIDGLIRDGDSGRNSGCVVDHYDQRTLNKVGPKVNAVKHEYEGGNLRSLRTFTYEYVKEQLESPLQKGKKFVFVKEMVYGIHGHYDQLPRVPFVHTFLIRNPNRTALSYQRIEAHLNRFKGDPLDFEIGPGTGSHPYPHVKSRDPLYDLWKYVRENLEPNPVVIDADDLQNHTAEVMEQYCAAVGIPWDAKYLSWTASDNYLTSVHGAVEEIVWGKVEGTYKSAFESTEMVPCRSDPPDNIPTVSEGYAEGYREGYKVMYQHRLKPAQARLVA